MKKLFTAIRHYDLDTVKTILEKNSELANCVCTPPPKKDVGQSPLQVAIKAGAFHIAYYLINMGADVNFIESDDCGSNCRMPLLHDCIICVFYNMCYGIKNADISDKYVDLLDTLLEHRANPNKRNTSGFDALDECVQRASFVLDSNIYSSVHDFVKKQLERVLDLLLEHGADLKEWSERNYLSDSGEFGTNRLWFLDDFKPVPDKIESITIKGRTSERTIKGDIDLTAKTRACIQDYCASRKIKI